MRRDHTNSPDRRTNSEDPMREAVALVERVELRTGEPQTPSGSPAVVAGFRRNGFLSVYWGDDPYYQFDDLGRLRRALIDGRLFRTEGLGLAQLTRESGPCASALLRHDLDRSELADFRQAMLARVGALHEALVNGHIEIVQQVPPESPVVDRLVTGLEIVLHAAGQLAPAINPAR